MYQLKPTLLSYKKYLPHKFRKLKCQILCNVYRFLAFKHLHKVEIGHKNYVRKVK